MYIPKTVIYIATHSWISYISIDLMTYVSIWSPLAGNVECEPHGKFEQAGGRTACVDI